MITGLVAAAADTRDGAMLALIPESPDAFALGVDGAIPAGDIHCTLAVLPDASQLTDEQATVAAAVAEAAAQESFGRSGVFGAAVLNEDTDRACVVLLVRADGDLVDMWHDLTEAVEFADRSYPAWLPHITLAYRADLSEGPAWEEAVAMARQKIGMPFSWAAVRFSAGERDDDYPITGSADPDVDVDDDDLD